MGKSGPDWTWFFKVSDGVLKRPQFVVPGVILGLLLAVLSNQAVSASLMFAAILYVLGMVLFEVDEPPIANPNAMYVVWGMISGLLVTIGVLWSLLLFQ